MGGDRGEGGRRISEEAELNRVDTGSIDSLWAAKADTALFIVIYLVFGFAIVPGCTG